MNRPSILQAVPSGAAGYSNSWLAIWLPRRTLIVQQCAYVCFLDERVEQDGAQQRERLLAIAGRLRAGVRETKLCPSARWGFAGATLKRLDLFVGRHIGYLTLQVGRNAPVGEQVHDWCRHQLEGGAGVDERPFAARLS